LTSAVRAARAAGLFLLATAVMTYPLVVRAWDTVPFRIDPLLLTWTLDWELHQLLTRPLALFDANIFWPYHGTLAYTDLALPDLVVFAPVELLTGNPILAFNITLFAVIAASGWTAYLFARRMLGSELPAVGAGLVFAFCHYRWGQYVHLQVMSTVWIPLAFLFLDRYVVRRRFYDAALTFLCLLLQALTSFYLGLFLAIGLAIYFTVWLAKQKKVSETLRASAPLLACALAALVLLAPFALPYIQVSRELGFARNLHDVSIGGAAIAAFLRPAAGSLIYDRLLPLGRAITAPSLTFAEESFFPGLAATVLVVVGCLVYWSKGARLYLLMAGSAAVLSLGPFLALRDGQPTAVPLPYLPLFAFVPGFGSIRLPARMAIFAFLWGGLLVGLGLARIGKRWPAATQVGIALLLLDNVAVPRPTLPVPVGNSIPAVYNWLARQPDGPIVEFPIAPSRYDESTYATLAGYEYFAIYHRHASVLGYSGFAPPLYFELIDRAPNFPDLRTISFLRGEGVRYAIVHNAGLSAQRARDVARRAAELPDDLRLAGRWGTDDAYLIRPTSSPAQSPTVQVALPSSGSPGQHYRAVLQFEEAAEPAFLLDTARTLSVQAAWSPLDHAGDAGANSNLQVDLPLAFEQGITYKALDLIAPSPTGRYRLSVRSTDALFHFEASAEVQLATAQLGQEPLQLEQIVQGQTEVTPGSVALFGLRWSGSPGRRLTEFLQLQDASGQRWAADDAPAFAGQNGTETWPPGFAADELRGVKLPAGLPPGTYHAVTGWYDTLSGQPYRWLTPEGKEATSLEIGAIQVPASGPRPFVSADLHAGGWTGANLAPGSGQITAGMPVGALLFGAPDAPHALQLRLTLEQAGSHEVATVPPASAQRQFVQLSDTKRLRGDFQALLEVGSESASLGTVHVASPAPDEETADPPSVQIPIHARFDGAELVGLNRSPGHTTLIWHSLGAIREPLTVFVHVLGQAGQIEAQHDGQPAYDRLPTDFWAPGRYVIDDHPLAAMQGVAALEIGLYDAATGQRYPVRSAGGAADAVRLQLAP
jgi:hypothetical protein